MNPGDFVLGDDDGVVVCLVGDLDFRVGLVLLMSISHFCCDMLLHT